MYSEDKLFVTIFVSIITIVAASVLGGMLIYNARIENYIKEGYIQQRTVSSYTTIWVLAEDE